MTFPQGAFVLALAQNTARVIEVSTDAALAEVQLPECRGMPAGSRGRPRWLTARRCAGSGARRA